MNEEAVSSSRAVDSALPCHRLVESTQAQLAALKRQREELLAEFEPRSKRVREAGPHNRESPRRSTDGESRWLSYAALQEINASGGFQLLTAETSDRIEAEVAKEFSDDRIDRKACMVTDAWVFRCDACKLHIEELPLAAMRRVLKPQRWTTPSIQKYYDCSAFDDRFAGMLLSRRGLEQTSNGVQAWISRDALRSLQVTNARMLACDSLDNEPAPPRFAIADCFVAGTFEEVDSATLIERQAVGLVQTRGLIKVVYGGAGSMLQSHLLSWDNRHATIASVVPCVPTRDNFQVVLAGPMTTQQELIIAKQHECSGERVQRLHALMKRVNPLYADVREDPGFRGVDEPQRVYCTRLDGEERGCGLVAQARARQQAVGGPPEPEDAEAHETTVVQSETVLLETTLDEREEARLARVFDAVVGRPTFAVRRSTAILQQSDPSYMERLFPHLLTFGTGGLSCERRRVYSKREIVLHYLNLSTNRFAEDALFKMQMFDFLSTQRVKQGVFMRVKHDPGLASRATRITADELSVALEDRAKQRHAARTERPLKPSFGGVGLAESVLKSVNASSAKMWGSNEERDAFQRKIKSMTLMYGEPSIFWTLTPSPDGSIAVAFWTCGDLPNGRPKDLVTCTVVNMPSSADMKRLVMQNAVVQAHYYKLCSRILIDVLFGWDSVANKPKADPGIFGYVEALFYALEQQGRLRVHHHGLLWIAGMPKTKGDWVKVLGDESTRARFEDYCASIFAAELPVFGPDKAVACPSHGCDGELRPQEIHAKYKHMLKRGTPPPKVAVCTACASEFTDAEVASAAIERKWRELDTEGQAASTENAVVALKMRFGGLSTRKPVADVQLSRLLRKDQMHAYEHTHSCVKGRAGTKCRYGFFRDLEPRTCLTESGEMKLQRRVGNQWLNAYIPLWRRLMHFNMDARVLWSGQSLQAINYAMQYASKRQSVLDNIAVVEMALRRRIQREAVVAADKTDFQKGVGRLMSLAFSSSGVMEIGGPLATTIMLEGGSAKFSCQFERLALWDGLHMMSEEEVESSVVSRDDGLFIEPAIQKYMNRPQCLEESNWYDFCAWIKPSGNATSAQATSNSDCALATDNPLVLRQHLRTHGLVRAEYPRVPEIVGPRLPDARHLEDDDGDDRQAELYCRMAALLYCPFRDPKQFLDESGSAKQHFRVWRPLEIPQVNRALEFHQQYYFALAEASEYRNQQRTSDPDDTCTDQDVQPRDFGRGDAQTNRIDRLVSISSDVYTCAGDAAEATGKEEEELQCATEGYAITRLLSNNVVDAKLPADETGTVVVRTASVSKNDLEAFEHRLEVEQPQADVRRAMLDEETTEVTVEQLNASVAVLEFDGTAANQFDEVAPFCSVQAASRAFQLNKEQHMAFVHIAVPLLYKIASIALPTDSAFDAAPLIVTGPGGTGKSRIVDAVRCIAMSWKRPNCVMVVASTGIAAASLNGHTMHSSVGLGINQTHLPKQLQQPNDVLLARWDPVLCVIADELSMTDIGFFGLWEEALCKVKDCPDPFGGLVAVLMFDFCQLLTVRGQPLFRLADPKKPFNAIQARGSLLYKGVDKVVYLKQNMRFAQDPEWGEWLAKARVGEWVPDMRAFLRHVAPPPEEVLNGQFIQVISTDNAMRQRINDTATRIASRAFRGSRKVYAIPAKLPKGLKDAETAALQSLTDNQTGNIPVFLKAYIGMPMRVKSNQCIPKGVANGASGTIFHIDWPSSTSFTLKADGVWVATELPSNIYVNVENCPSDVSYPGLPDAWPTSVMPIAMTKASFKFQKRSVTIKGFPLVPAFGTTVHGVQGDTRDQIVVTDLRPPHIPRVDHHALYVSLSRLRTRAGLFWLGKKPDDSDLEYFRPSRDVLQEDQRLRGLAQQTALRTPL